MQCRPGQARPLARRAPGQARSSHWQECRLYIQSAMRLRSTVSRSAVSISLTLVPGRHRHLPRAGCVPFACLGLGQGHRLPIGAVASDNRAGLHETGARPRRQATGRCRGMESAPGQGAVPAGFQRVLHRPGPRRGPASDPHPSRCSFCRVRLRECPSVIHMEPLAPALHDVVQMKPLG